MAERKIEYKLSWTNGESFKLERRTDEGDWYKIVEVEENTHFSEISSALCILCMADIRKSVDTAIKEMEV